ncbi:MAG: amidase domain-containing protein [Bacillota bacterium]|nr:amidase domain-containing protein [Bacillota bacterium]
MLSAIAAKWATVRILKFQLKKSKGVNLEMFLRFMSNRRLSIRNIKVTRNALHLFLVISITFLSIVSVSAASVDPKTAAKAEAKNQIANLINSGYGPYYDILNLEMDITKVEENNNKIDVYALAKIKKVLKAKKVSELPYVKGMLKAVNLDDIDKDSAENTMKQIKASVNTKLNDERIERAAKLLQFKVRDLEQYIGQPQDGSLIFKYSVTKTSNGIDRDSGVLYAEDGIGNYFPAKNILPKSSTELESDGAKEIKDVINGETLSASVTSLYPGYDRLRARDYANQYTSTATTYCPHNKAQQNTAYWNTGTYPAYLYNFCHNDCADYVSQGLNYGGIPKEAGVWTRTSADKSWTYAWQNVRGLKDYMYDTKGYWTPSTYTSASAGGVRLWKTADGVYYHIAMIVQNDTVTRKFSAHTYDRKQYDYSNESYREYYILW